jgi:hypothetical protein
MLELMRFALIVIVTAVDSLLDEFVLSTKAAIRFVRRQYWIVRDKVTLIQTGRG